MKKIIYFSFILTLVSCGGKQLDQDFPVNEDYSIFNVSSNSKKYETANKVIYYDDFEVLDDMDNSDYYSETSNSSECYYYASVDGYGNVTVYDSNGNTYHYATDDYGNTSGYDSDGNYYHFHADDFGNTSGYDSNGNYIYTYTDDYGNTTGYDGNGNYYSAYTDDYGNTTITSY